MTSPDAISPSRSAVGGALIALGGAAPHLLHHVGPLAGAALLAGSTGQALFAVLGFLAAAPLLLRMRRRSGTWRRPAAVLAAMVAGFVVSSSVIGPALTDVVSADTPRQSQSPAAPAPASHTDHDHGDR